MLVRETADGFKAIIGALRSLDKSKCVSADTFSLPEDRCVNLLLKSLGKRMPEAESRKKLEVMHINAQAVIQLRSRCISNVASASNTTSVTVAMHL